MRQMGRTSGCRASSPAAFISTSWPPAGIADPFVGDEELRVQWVAESDWEYRREFTLEAAMAAEERLALVFDGLDTLAETRLNGELLGSADNMFRTWRWDVTHRLRPGPNELTVRLPLGGPARGRAGCAAPPHLGHDQLPGAPYLRKAPCPLRLGLGAQAAEHIGFWQGVHLEGWSTARLENVRIEQVVERPLERAVERSVERARGPKSQPASRSNGRATPNSRRIEAVLRVVHPNGRIEAVRSVVGPTCPVADLAVEIGEPELWWPNGFGSQPLYRVEVELVAGGGRIPGRSLVPGRPAEPGASSRAGRMGRVVRLRRQRRAGLREGLELGFQPTRSPPA